MMRLDLTLQEAASLRNALAHVLALPEAGAHAPALKSFLEKVVEAEELSTRSCRCPVCQQLFTQESQGRTGLYCSSACKQKAYRQRRNAWRRQTRPSVSR